MPFPADQKYPDLHEEIVLMFREAQLEMVQCSLCGDYHPPDIHIAPLASELFDCEEDY
jgi:hypothetical protein